MPSAAPTAFSSRRTEIATTAGVDSDGNSIPFSVAAAALEAKDEWSGYEVIAVKRDGDEIRAKLQLRNA
jgi:hypothetical protein